MVSTTIFIDGSQVQSLLKDVILIIIRLCLENLNFPLGTSNSSCSISSRVSENIAASLVMKTIQLINSSRQPRS